MAKGNGSSNGAGRATEWSADRPEGAAVVGHVLLRFRVHPKDEDGFFVGECEELGVSSFGTTVDEAIHATLEATAAYLDALDDSGERDRVFAEQGVTFCPALSPPGDDFDIRIDAKPGEFVSAQRLSVREVVPV